MSFPIPSQLPELNVPLTARSDLPPVAPVVAVPGVPEVAQALDSRVALQWSQPVLAGESTAALKNSTQSSPAAPAAHPAAALLELDALSSLEGQAPIGHWLSALTANNRGQPVPWPSGTDLASGVDDPNGMAAFSSGLQQPVTPLALQVLGQMQGLYAALAQSPLFAAQRLAQRWQRGALASQPGTTQGATGAELPSASHQALQWAADLGALAPDAEAAQQAALCLTNGTMVWQGALVNGLPAELQREDAWRESPAHPGQIEKGVALTLQTQLPHMGPIQITARQWGDEFWIDIGAQSEQGALLKAQVTQLQARLGNTDKIHIQWQGVAS